MIIMTVVDDHGGLCFNQRRQSQDRKLRQRMLEIAGTKGIWMDAYSASMFTEAADRIHVDDDFLNQAGQGDFCFVEDKAVLPYADRIEKIILFRWNRAYPFDMYFDITLESPWRLQESHDFSGFSHDTITEEVYAK